MPKRKYPDTLARVCRVVLVGRMKPSLSQSELPDKADRSLSLCTCAQLAIQLTADGTVESISPQSVQRILQSSKLKPWRVHD